MADTLNTSEEQQLLEAVKQAVALVDDGTSPDEAIEKVARDHGYGPGKIRVIAHAYNNGRQLSQWNQRTNILDKLASFPLADPDHVIERIYHGQTPTEKAANDAVSSEYAFPPSWLEQPRMEKKARSPWPVQTIPPEPYQKDPVEALHKALGSVQRAKQAADEANRLAGDAENNVRIKVTELVNYFKQASYSRLPFEHVENAARSYIGDATKPLLDVVYQQARLREKRASDKLPIMPNGINLKTEPFTFIRAAVKAAEDCIRLRAEAIGKVEAVTTTKEAALRPFSGAEGSKPSAQQSSVLTLGVWDDRAANIFGKQASGWGSEVAAIAAGDVIGQGLHESMNKKEKEKEEEEDPLDDAGQQKEISSIKNRVALDTMLADPKNPLSKLPAPDVVKAYNDIVQVTPHLANKVEALQPLLEAHFQGSMGHKLHDAAKLDKVVAAIDKMAFLDTGVALGAGMAGRALGDYPKTKSDLIEDKWLELEDPHHQNELRRIKAHAMLTQLLTDPEDPISGHDPDKVLSAYNEIASATPRVADNVHALRPALRRKLEGHQEPFETKELLDIEKGLTATRLPTPSTHALTNAPEKLLG